MTPEGSQLDQNTINSLSKEEHLIIVCGHYEGIDERVKEYIDTEISIGDYVLTGGELPSAILVDSICRLIPGVVKEMESVTSDSFYNSLLDFPHYTRPADLNDQKAPEVLTGGNHEEIRKWRRKMMLERTLYKRPDLLANAEITPEDRVLLQGIILNTST